ncbi:NUDIX hydrolase [Bradyrhizobium sp. Arg68]|uniref:NUDIX hydrolase n=1 Tax=Bradyrhizobium ivorense TaxID=2511166 RepID=UPI001E370BEA|nr:NUDIX hydrolase [Bradyrhizobium ivorense]MCC8937911.1 NUDIX hydrolase [Bradyrhizobium ivorense]
MAEIAATRPASTVLLLREGTTSAEIEIFMMVRHHQIEFNSGALVFPGGSVDKNDNEIAANPALYSGGEGLDADALGFRIAGVRETFEESGILLARPKGSAELVDAKRADELALAHRSALNEGKITFEKILDDNGLVLALDTLVPYAHWITPEGMPKRFDTWFFLAAAPPEQLGAHDGKESTDSIWVSAREALAGGESGRFKLPFPTTRNLIRLGKQPNVAAALEDSKGMSIVTVMPVMTKTATGRQLRIPKEAGYDGEVFDVGAMG